MLEKTEQPLKQTKHTSCGWQNKNKQKNTDRLTEQNKQKHREWDNNNKQTSLLRMREQTQAQTKPMSSSEQYYSQCYEV